MPKDPRIKKVLVIGSGPIIIGQAAEFDYSGTQACRALKAEGIETVLLNSNPATIMTDPDVADHVYIEPMTLEVVERILDIEKPDSVLPNLELHARRLLHIVYFRHHHLGSLVPALRLLGALGCRLPSPFAPALFRD